MRLLSFRTGSEVRLGILRGDDVVDVGAAGGPVSMRDLILAGPGAAEELEDRIAESAPHFALGDVDLAPPVPDPPNIVCVGRNYPSHVVEEDASPPESPLLFSKHTSALCGPADTIQWSRSLTEQVDFEAELAVIIGQPTSDVAADDALTSVFGYMCANDVSARDIQFNDGQWWRGKSLRSFFPTGPVLVTSDEVDDPQNLELRCTVNGIQMQVGHTSEMLFSIAEIISHCSRAFTLFPGDIISTGTPSGVGVFRNPPLFLGDGDVVEVEVSGLGHLRNVCRVTP